MADNSSAIFFGVLVIAAGFAVISKPPRDGFAPEMAQLVVEETTQALSASLGGGDELRGLGVVTRAFSEECHGAHQSCAGFFRNLLPLEEDDYVVGRLVRSTRGEAGLYCIGAYNTWKCWFDDGRQTNA